MEIFGANILLRIFSKQLSLFMDENYITALHFSRIKSFAFTPDLLKNIQA